MALLEFKKDMDIILALDDEPNDVGGLSADELKAKFDEGGKALQDYINTVLVPYINALGEGHDIENSDGEKLPSRKVLRFLNAVLRAEEDAIVIDTNGKDGEDGESAYEAAQKGGYKGTEAAFNADLATVGTKADATKITEVTLYANKWTEIENGYTQQVTVLGGKKTDLVALQPTAAQVWQMADDGVLALMVNNDNGVFTAVVVGEAPQSDMTIQASLTDANDIRGGGGVETIKLAKPTIRLVTGSGEPVKLATPAIRLSTGDDAGGGDTDDSEYTPAILGVAILGRTILGMTDGDYEPTIPQLTAPSIRIETVTEIPKLSAPVIMLETVAEELPKLAKPSIKLETVVYTLTTPEIQLVEV